MYVDLGSKVCELEFQRITKRLDDQEEEENLFVFL